MVGQLVRKGIIAGVICVLGCAGMSCAGQEAGALRIGGNGSALGALKLLAAAYQKTHPEVSVTVVPNLGSSGGIAALRQGALDLAVTARPLRPEEQTEGLREAEYARTPFIFATQRATAKSDLTSYELVSLYYQDSPLWPDGTRVRLVLRPERDTDSVIIRRISPEMERALKHAHARAGMYVAVTDQESLDAIAKMPGSLGSATLTEIITEQRPVHPFSYNDVQPTLKNLANGSYPLVKTYYLVTAEKSGAAARDFAAFLRTARGREILRKAGNLPSEAARGH